MPSPRSNRRLRSPASWAIPSERTTSWAIWGWRYWGSAKPRAGASDRSSRGWDTPDHAAIIWARKQRWSGWGLLTGIYVSIRLRSPASSRPFPWPDWSVTGCRRRNLLWYQGIQHAELGQRDLAIAKAEESIALFKAMGRPQAAWYGSHLAEVPNGSLRRERRREQQRRERFAAVVPGGSDRCERDARVSAVSGGVSAEQRSWAACGWRCRQPRRWQRSSDPA